MMLKYLPYVALLVMQSACSGDASSNPSSTGGAGTSAGVSGAGGTGVGGTTATPVGGMSTAAGAGSVVGCPDWPHDKMMPWVGIFYFGPDPGPCSSEDYEESDPLNVLGSASFAYDANGQFLTHHSDLLDTTVTCSWSGSSLQSCNFPRASGLDPTIETYVWGTNSLIATAKTGPGTGTSEYALSANGYPLTAVITNVNTGVTTQTGMYEYENCRLTRRTSAAGTGVPIPGASCTYQYDAVGHIIRQRFDDGSVTEYDYSCWSN